MVEPQISPFNQFQKEDKSHIKKAGLCYLELVTLKKLWESANKTQKNIILHNVITIKVYSAKVPHEAGVSFLVPKREDSQLKRRIHT